MFRAAICKLSIFAITVLLLSTIAAGQSPKKIALLVGVADYFHKNMEDLQFAENDVNVIGKELKLLGFSVNTVTGRSATKEKVDAAIKSFLKQTESLENNDIVFVMFSGHGQQLMAVQEKKIIVDEQVRTVRQKAETPYFCPRDAVPFNRLKHDLAGKSEIEIAEELKLVSLNQVIAGLDDQSNSRQNLFVVDACRNNPAKGKTANITGSTTRELPSGLSILFAAKSGQKSWESSDSKIKHGVMSHFLIQGLKGKAKNRRDEVTWKRLVAFIAEELEYDAGKLAGASDRKQNPHVIGSSSNLIVLGKRLVPKILSAPFSKSEIDIAREQWANYLGTKQEFKNSVGLDMVIIPSGKFTMGNPYNNRELANLTGFKEQDLVKFFRRSVNVNESVQNDFTAGKPVRTKSVKPFLISKTEVSFDLFSRFAKETKFVSKTAPKNGYIMATGGQSFPFGGSWENTGFKVHGEAAVRNVSAADAEEFCQWLSKKTNRRYRLPTETEWEFVAKAGADTVWHFGNEKDLLIDLIPKISEKNDVPSVDAELPNNFGVQGMLFGVQEICTIDQLHESKNSFCEKGSRGPTFSAEFTIRNDLVRSLPFTGRLTDKSGAGYWIGFRVVCEVED